MAMKPTEPETEVVVSLCDGCGCMTKTIHGGCGKCGTPKSEGR